MPLGLLAAMSGHPREIHARHRDRSVGVSLPDQDAKAVGGGSAAAPTASVCPGAISGRSRPSSMSGGPGCAAPATRSHAHLDMAASKWDTSGRRDLWALQGPEVTVRKRIPLQGRYSYCPVPRGLHSSISE